MDIEEYKKFVKNKIDSENLTKKVRNIIKEVQWQKQDMREGFTESFKPLIESQENVKKSIDEQQNSTIKQLQNNQLAITQGLDQNRLAITQGLDQNRLAITQGLENLNEEKFEDAQEEIKKEEKKKEEIKNEEKKIGFDFDLSFFNNNLQNENSISILKKYGYDSLPLDFLPKKNDVILKIIDDVYSLKNQLGIEIINTSVRIIKVMI